MAARQPNFKTETTAEQTLDQSTARRVAVAPQTGSPQPGRKMSFEEAASATKEQYEEALRGLA
jgi:hypothetical protein